ncbi:DNA replication complex GINS protein PSF1 [Pseudolycoriella hygida]|uniref:DNA replication complex GINS protein PSF1 n=1 Tax=Pseudolycoriella hygida TaxID=35572 RepID=A0A9Q0MYH8_9DIPT|nr:DNA replication complex GINS protein PSF1 [Pseudolycoriella hygida]
MFGEQAFELIKELERNSENLPPFNDEIVRGVLDEINAIFEENRKDANTVNETGDRSLIPLLMYRDASLYRNKRCVLAYLYNRLKRIKEMRWQFGVAIPNEIKSNLCEPEIQWFNAYTQNLGTYMRSIGDDIGLNLTDNVGPPKSLYVEVRCVTDYGKYELENGDVILLRENSQHYLPRVECEPLIRQGILEHLG